MDTTYEAEDELRSPPEQTLEPEESEAESYELEDPHNGPQYESTSQGEGINFGGIRMAPMSVIDHNDVNYKVKLAVMHQLEKNPDKKITKTLVEEPKKGALGGHQKNPKEKSNPKGNKGEGKPEPALVPTFDVKLHVSRDAGKYPMNRPSSSKRTLMAHMKIARVKAYALFNSGAETDAISLDFIQAVHIPILQLESPVVLQMGMKGTRSQIIYCME